MRIIRYAAGWAWVFNANFASESRVWRAVDRILFNLSHPGRSK